MERKTEVNRKMKEGQKEADKKCSLIFENKNLVAALSNRSTLSNLAVDVPI